MSEYIKPRPRPKVTTGITVETKVGCGSLYVTINEDEHGIFEVFLKLGKSGVCSASQTEALGKMISLALRCNVNPEEIVRRLKGIRCPNIIWQDGEQITSCADAVAKTLEKYLKGEFHKVKAGAEKSAPLTEFADIDSDNGTEAKTVGISKAAGNASGNGNGTGKDVAHVPHAYHVTATNNAICPDCGSTMHMSEGCQMCLSCGYSKCG